MEMEQVQSTVETAGPAMSFPAPALPSQLMPALGMIVNVSGGDRNGGENDLERKKRGRPRKYGPDGTMALSLSTCFTSTDGSGARKGRPPGTGKRQMLAACGDWVFCSAGGSFLPHVVNVAAGEDVARRILSFCQQGPRSICILSANGSISNVTLRQPCSSGGTLTYEGRFEIVSLSGSFTLTDIGGIRSRTGGISVSLAGPDGRVVGGSVTGLLLAASPIQIVVGSFMPNTPKVQKKGPNPESHVSGGVPTTLQAVTDAKPLSHAVPEDDTCDTPISTPPAHSHGEGDDSENSHQKTNSACGWPVSRTMSEQKSSPDINVPFPMD